MLEKLLLIVFIDVEEVRWIEPSHGEEIVLSPSGELFPKTSQMYPESIFTRDVIHSEEMIDSLPWQKRAQPLWCETPVVKPVYVPHVLSVPLIIILLWNYCGRSLLNSCCPSSIRCTPTPSLFFLCGIRFVSWWQHFLLFLAGYS